MWRKKNKYKAESPIFHNPPNKEEKEKILGYRLVYVFPSFLFIILQSSEIKIYISNIICLFVEKQMFPHNAEV